MAMYSKLRIEYVAQYQGAVLAVVLSFGGAQ
jgi:hypothetical protein